MKKRDYKNTIWLPTLIIIFHFANFVASQQPPNFLWAKQLGGTNTDKGYSIDVDNLGNIYTTGAFYGVADFDPGPAVYNLTAGNYDIFVSKLDSNGNFIWAVKFGESYADYGYAITVDADGNVYTTGYFQGTVDFDPGPGIHTLTSSGNADVFISKLGPSGNFIWAKKIGGTGSDYGYGIAVNAIGNVSVTGSFVNTVDFDPGPGTFNMSSVTQGFIDAFVLTLDASGNFLWAKTWGTQYHDAGSSIVINPIGNIITTGRFQGTADFDPGPGVFELTSEGNSDIFICALNASGNFLWAKRIGGGSDDIANQICLDPDGNILTTGYFYNTVDFDPGPLVFNLTGNVFVSKLDPFGNFIWAKAFVGGGDGIGKGITTDLNGNVYTVGRFDYIFDFDPGPEQYNIHVYGNYQYTDAYICKLDQNGGFVWAVKIGGTSNDEGLGIAVDDFGNVYSTGFFSGTGDFDPGPATYNLTAGNFDIFVEKLCQLETPTITASGSTTICQGDSVILTSSPAHAYLWSNGMTTQSIAAKESGNYSVTVFNSNGCPAYSILPVTVITIPMPPPVAEITPNGPVSICLDDSINLAVNVCAGCSYLWNTGQTTQSILVSPPESSTYWVTVSNAAGCSTLSNTVTVNVVLPPTISIIGDNNICFGDSTQLTASGATSYTWSPVTGLSNPNIQNPMASPQTTTTYIVTGTKDGCSDTAAVTVTVNVVDVEVSGDTSLCNGEIIYNLTASGADTYSWLPETGLSDPGAANPEVSPPSTTTYTITGTVGECTGQTSVKITVKPKPVVEGYGATSICEGASAQLNASGAPAYSWAPTQSLDNANIQNPVATPPATTTYVVTGILNGCTDTAWVKVTVNPIPVITLAGPTYAICPEEPALLFAYADIGIDKWLWEPAGSLSNPAIFNPVATPAMTTTYTVTGTTADECSDTASITITVTPLPGQPGPITGEATACSGAIQQYSVPTVAGADSYNWTIPSGWTGSSNASSITVTPSPGTGQISVTAENECGESPPSTFSVTIHETPEKPIISKLDPITLKSSSPIGNQWYKNGTMIQGETGELLVVADTGYYKVIVTINGCSSEESDQEYVEPPSSVNSVNSEPSIALFPNPTTGILHIRASGLDSGPCQLQLANSLGEVVTEWEGETDGSGILDIQLDLSGFASGVYYLTILSEKGQYSSMVVKNN